MKNNNLCIFFFCVHSFMKKVERQRRMWKAKRDYLNHCFRNDDDSWLWVRPVVGAWGFHMLMYCLVSGAPNCCNLGRVLVQRSVVRNRNKYPLSGCRCCKWRFNFLLSQYASVLYIIFDRSTQFNLTLRREGVHLH